MKKYPDFSEQELSCAIELMATPDDLMSRVVMEAILSSLEYSPEEVAEQLESGERLNDGQMISWNF